MWRRSGKRLERRNYPTNIYYSLIKKSRKKPQNKAANNDEEYHCLENFAINFNNQPFNSTMQDG